MKRLWITGLVLVIIGVGAFVGLGWAYSSSPRWLMGLNARLPRGMEQRIRTMYGSVASALLPRDQDGDGVSDGLELFQDSDARDATRHRPLFFATSDREDNLLLFDAKGDPPTHPRPLRNELFQPAGERRQVQRCLMTSEGPAVADGFQVRIVPSDSRVRLAHPGARVLAEPLVVAVHENGKLVFDLELTANAAGAVTDDTISFDNAATGENISIEKVIAVREDVAITVTVEAADPDELNKPVYRHIIKNCTAFHIHWPSVRPVPRELHFQVALDPAGSRWATTHSLPPDATSAVLVRFFGKGIPASKLPKFRIVPIYEPSAPF
jgi:hypothetical protein